MKRRRKTIPAQSIEIDGKTLPSIGAWARGAQIAPSTISKLLSAPRIPRSDTAAAMAACIGVSTDRLLGWLSERHRPHGSKGSDRSQALSA